MSRCARISLPGLAALLIGVGVLAGARHQTENSRAARNSASRLDAREQIKPIVRPVDDVTWKPGPDSLPPGAEIAILEGDITKAESYTFRLRLPEDYTVPPHWHPVPERVTVLEGEVGLGMGDEFDSENLTPLPQGSLFIMPPRHRHFIRTNEKTVIQLHGTGPWGIHYVDPADDPRSRDAEGGESAGPQQ